MVSGVAAISAPSATSVLITQSSRNAILNWGSFSIGAGNAVRFENGSGATLNRVTGLSRSQIDGALTATGSVYLVNPNGITVGPTGAITTGGSFVASTHDVSDAAFMAGGDLTFRGTSTASVINYGSIGSLGGDVALIARTVENVGTLTAPNGTAALAAGYEVLVRDSTLSDGKFVVKVGGAETQAKTSGVIKAAEVELRANGGNVYALAGNTASITKATGVASKGGRIFFTAGDSGTVEVSQKVVARVAISAGKTKGGKIQVSGKTVSLSSTLDAKGKGERGGEIAVTADFISNTGILTARGTDGGKITLSARAVANSGQGDASGTSGTGGTVSVSASGAYVETSGAGMTANGTTGGGVIGIDAGRIFSSGTLTATASAGTGGRITLGADDIALVAARLDASGATGGGTILVGGDYQGGGTLRHALTLDISPATSLSADATTAGKGGTIVLWSDEATSVYGAVSARGGAQSGDGGLVEMSSKGLLTMAGTVSASATAGSSGTLLLDPKTIIIDNGTGAYPQYQLVDPNPSAGNNFGSTILVLSTGKVAVTASGTDLGGTDAGAVYLYDATTGALISQLYGATANDQVGSGGVVALTNGNYVVRSANWGDGAATGAGAVTWGSGTSGVSGVVSASNSLVGSTASDQVGGGGITALTTGDYVVRSSAWDNGAIIDAGAVTWGSGTSGVSGVVSGSNSLVGSTANDQLGSGGIIALTTGNYLVFSPNWANGAATVAGAVTWASGTSGVSGVVSASNSLVGSTANDQVGSGGIAALTNGNYVVASPNWANGAATRAGAATWGSGTSGVSGVVSASNSLVGSTAGDQVGNAGITALSNGNYLVKSGNWANGAIINAGAATWGSGTSGVTGVVSAANSLVGSTANDQVGNASLFLLSDGNYVMANPNWDNGAAVNAGAVTWGSGISGVSGVVSASNSLVGSTTADNVGFGVTVLNNGNYVVTSPNWDNGAIVNAGAATWGSGTSGVSGVVSASNSLVGSTTTDRVGSGGVALLTNGNYLVASQNWTNGAATGAGAVTWGSGTSGVSGVVSAANSLVGSTTGDGVGNLTVLTNGNYVVRSSLWDNGAIIDAGAATWGSGTSGVTGVVSAANSLVGSTANDQVGTSATALSNGNYVVRSSGWDNGTAANAGAVTWGSGTSGVTGVVSASNSLVGSTAGDQLGNAGVTALSNGNYVVRSSGWDNGTAVNAGAVTWGSGTSGVSGVVSASNSLVGSTTNDQVGAGFTALTNGNYVVLSSNWDNGAATNAGAATWGSGTSGVSGVVSAANSLVGSTANDRVGSNGITVLTTGDYVVRSASWANGAATSAGAVTWGSRTSGVTGVVSAANSVVGSTANDQVGSGTISESGLTFFASSFGTTRQILAGLTDINAASGGLTFSRAMGQTVTLTSAALTSILNAGTNLVLQASNDISVQSAISASSGAGLSLSAGRSITVSANISVGGDLTLLANAPQSAGVVMADRDAGAAVLDVSAATLTSGGRVKLTLGTGDGRTNNTSGNIILGSISAQALEVENLGPTAGSLTSFRTSITTSGNQTYTGNLSVDAASVVLNATTGTVSWTDEATASISGVAGAAITFAQAGVPVRIGVMDSADAARLNVGETSATRLYGDANPDVATPVLVQGTLRPGDTLATLLTPGSATVNWTGAAPTATSNVGSYGYGVDSSTATIAAGNQGYFFSLGSVSGTLAVTARPVTVTADAQTQIYGNAVPTLTYTTTSLGAGTALTGSLATSATSSSDVGSYGITQGTLTTAANPNYTVSYVGANLAITARPITVTADSQSMVYGDGVPTLTYTTSSLGAGTALTGSLATSATSSSDVGGYGITQGTLTTAANPNYTVSYVGANLAITSRPVTVTADAQTQIYGNAVPTLTYTTTSLGAGTALTGSLATSATSSSDVGGYGITQGTLTTASNPNYTVSYVGANLAITARPVTVTADAQTQIYGDAVPTLTYTTSSLGAGTALTGSLATSATSSSDVGGYGITQGTLTTTANPNYTVSYVGANLAITARPITVTADAQTQVYGNAVPTLTYTTSSLGAGAALTGTLDTAATSASDVGSYGITQGTLTTAANPNYTVSYVAANLAITARPVTVTADSQTQVYGDTVPGLTYTTSSLGAGSALSGSLATSATSASDVGSYGITQGTLTTASNPNYTVSYVGANLAITARPVTVTADSQTQVYGDTVPGLTYTTSSLGAGSALSGSLATSATSSSNVGSYGITQGTLTTASNPNYTVSYVGANLAITARPVTVTADSQTQVYGDTVPGLTYTTSSLGAGAALTGSLATAATSSSDVGSYGITQGTLTTASNPNYTVSYVGANLAITARPVTVTVTADAQTQVYGNAVPTLTYTTTSLGAGSALSGSLATSATSSSNVGSYGITQGTLTTASNPNYTVSYVGANLAITARPVTVTADAQTQVYGNAVPTLTYTTSSLGAGAALSGSQATSATSSSNVGSYGITQGTLTTASNPNYTVSYVGANLAITARPVTVTADAQTQVYGNAVPPLTYTMSSLGAGTALNGTLDTSATSSSNVGSYGITQGTLTTASNPNYTVSYVGANLAITARPVTVTADAQTQIYGDAVPTLTYTTSSLGAGAALTGTLATAATSSSDVGGYGITQGTLTTASNPNYTVSYVGANLAITARPVTVTADAQTQIYGNAVPTLTYTTTSLGAGAALTGSLATSATSSSDVGGYGITQGTLTTAANPNYTVSYVGANLAITARPLTVTADSQSMVYGTSVPTLTYVVGGGGLVNGDGLTGVLATTASSTSNVGSYGITQGTLAASSNYALTYTGANVAVTARPLTVTADNQSMVYGNSVPTLTFEVGGSGLVNDDSLTGALATMASSTANVGAYGITQGTVTASSNYALTFTGANVAVTTRPITVTADNESRTFGAANPVLTWSLSSGNLVNGDRLTGFLGTSADATSPAGAYPIVQNTLAASSNYRLTYVGGVLTVTPAPGGGNTGGGGASGTPAQVAQTVILSSLPTLLIPQAPTDQWVQTSQTVVLIQESGSDSGTASSSASASASSSGCSGSSFSSACEGTPHPDNQSFGRWLTFQAQSGAAR